MITTLTLNPAIDKTLIVEDFSVNDINRVRQVNIDAGGKGINASKVIRFLGEETAALGFVGGTAGRDLVSMLDAKGISHDFIWISGQTRINTKIVDVKNNTCTDVNEPGPYVAPEDIKALKSKVREYASKSGIMIFSGNTQESIPETIYRDIMGDIKPSGVKVVLDSSGRLLREGLKAVPWLVKPNVAEFEEAAGVSLGSLDEIRFESRKINGLGVEYVCVSMGHKGLLLVTGEAEVLAVPPPVRAESTVGAGDAVVGSLAVSLIRGEGPSEALRRACAISAASVTLPGTSVPGNDLIEDIYKRVETKILETAG